MEKVLRLTQSFKINRMSMSRGAILSVFGIFISFFDEAYLLNPFVLPLLFVAMSFNLVTFFFVAGTLVSSSLMQSFPYAMEMVFVCSIYFFLTLVPKHMITSQVIKNLVPVIACDMIIIIFYFSREFSFNILLNAAISLLITSVEVVACGEIITKLRQSSFVGNDFTNLLFFAFFPFILKSFPPLLVIAIVCVNLIYFISAEKRELKLLLVFISFVCGKFLLNFSEFELIYIFIPLFATALFSGVYLYFVYFVSATILLLFQVDGIFIAGESYQLLIALFLSLLYDFLFKAKVSQLLFRHHDEKSKVLLEELVFQKEGLNNLKNYLDLLSKNDKFEVMTPLQRTSAYLDNELCLSCPKRLNCLVKETIVASLEEGLDEERKKKINHDCLYPRKLVYRLRNLKSVYEREKGYYAECSRKKSAYESEIKTIFSPVIDSLAFCPLDEKTILGKLKQSGIKSLVKVERCEEKISLFTTKKLDVSEKEIITQLLKSLLKRHAILKEEQFILKDSLYLNVFSCDNKITVEYNVVASSYSSSFPSGDKVHVGVYENDFILTLADGMGHDEDASKVSEYLINFIDCSLKLSNNIDEILSSANKILKIKEVKEQYATLDLLKINLATSNATFYKCGSYKSYLLSRDSFKEVDKIGLPLGIVEEAEVGKSNYEFVSGDIIIMMSDGMDFKNMMFIESEIKKLQNKDIFVLSKELYASIVRQENVNDDATLIVLRIC